MLFFEVFMILLLWTAASILLLLPSLEYYTNLTDPLIIKKSMSIGNMIRFVLCLPISIVTNLVCCNAFSCFWKALVKLLNTTPFDKG